MMRVAITTLGCKVNRVDGEALMHRIGHLARRVSFESPADLFIINSCTVTASADRQSRQMINRARRRNPEARVVLTGCMAATLDPENLVNLGLDGAFALELHPRLLALVEDMARDLGHIPDEQEEGPPPASSSRDRPVIKVQDGCDCCCTYCIIPQARGPSRSVPPGQIVEEVRNLQSNGVPEVVFTGIHLGHYGQDLTPATSLPRLLGQLPSGPDLRVRLSSIEPLEVTAGLRACLLGADDSSKNSARGGRPSVCPHLHIPIQSGDDGILAAMGRPYGATEVIKLLDQLRQDHPDMGLGADLMTGFPGEDETAFLNTLNLVEGSPLTYLHVFPYSRRAGTAAADMPGQVSRAVAKERAAVLRGAGRAKQAAFSLTQLGRSSKVVAEGRADEEGLLSGLTANYLRVRFAGSPELRGKLVAVKLVELVEGELIGEIEGTGGRGGPPLQT